MIKNFAHYGLNGYIYAELIMRLFYDSMYIAVMRGRTILEIPYRTIEEYSYKVNHTTNLVEKDETKTTTLNSNEKGFWNSIRKCLTSIYIWDNTFRYTTMAICTYTVAYLFLIHLFCTVILLYSTHTNSYTRYIREMFQFVMQTGMF